MEYPLSRKDGRIEWHFGSFSPIGPNTIALISTTITERKRAEEENIRLLKETQELNQELQASQHKLQEAQKIARLGNWELDVVSKKMDWSEELFRIFGLNPALGVPDFETYIQLICPEFRKEFQSAVAESIESGKEYELEVKIKATDVPFRCCVGMGRPVLNDEGKVVKVIGIWYDITDRKIAEEQVKELLRSTQEMYDQVLSGEEELRQSLEKTLELNEKILESEERLRRQNDDLRKINSELDNFVYRTSHDLRSPLVSILGLINISRIEKDESKKAAYLTLIEKSIIRLDTFISDIINYSRNSRLEIVKSEINFQMIIKETLDGLRFLEGFDTIEIKSHINQVAPFFSDLVRVKMICNNMISNAIKYRSTLTTQSQIHISVEVGEKKAVLVFQDNGIGIKEENLEKIFDMFYRASAFGAGSGLGLYIVKDVVNTLNGSIKVQSQVGKGTTFTIEIPNLVNREDY
jgi:signal transduction histidine kinase